MTVTVKAKVSKYIPNKLYGFAEDEHGSQVFFHLGSFDPGSPLDPSKQCSACPPLGCPWSTAPSPPILGEAVEVKVDFSTASDGRAPRADRVTRLQTPTALRGTVETFDPLRGYGFARGEDGISYHLH